LQKHPRYDIIIADMSKTYGIKKNSVDKIALLGLFALSLLLAQKAGTMILNGYTIKVVSC